MWAASRSMVSPMPTCSSGVRSSSRNRLISAAWPSAASARADRPSGVSVATRPRPSPSAGTRSIQPRSLQPVGGVGQLLGRRDDLGRQQGHPHRAAGPVEADQDLVVAVGHVVFLGHVTGQDLLQQTPGVQEPRPGDTAPGWSSDVRSRPARRRRGRGRPGPRSPGGGDRHAVPDQAGPSNSGADHTSGRHHRNRVVAARRLALIASRHPRQDGRRGGRPGPARSAPSRRSAQSLSSCPRISPEGTAVVWMLT